MKPTSEDNHSYHVTNHPRLVEHRGTLSLDDKYQLMPRNVCIIPFRRNRMSEEWISSTTVPEIEQVDIHPPYGHTAVVWY